DRADVVGNHAAGHGDHAALLEGVDAEAGDVGDFEGEVDLALVRELAQLDLVAEQLPERPFGVLGAERLGPLIYGEDPVDAKQRPGANFQVQVRAAPVHELIERPRNVEHAPIIGTPPMQLESPRGRWTIYATSRSFCASARLCSFFSDWFSIWRIRSRVTLKVRPTSSSVRGCSPPRP